MSEVWTMGEMLVEIMRPRPDMPLGTTGEFLGPFPSGAPAIFIDTLARLGRSAAIAGAVGEDEFGRCVGERLSSDGVDTSAVAVHPALPTAAAFVSYRSDGSRRFIFHLASSAAARAELPSDAELRGTRFFHVMGCSLMVEPALRGRIAEAAARFEAAGARISFDPNIRPELLRGENIHEIADPILKRCSLLLPGEAELQILSGERGSDAGCRALFERYPLELIVVKQGGRGSTIYTRTERLPVPAYAVEEVDPTGAGDCFDAGFICGLIEGRSVRDCGRLAAAAGALNAEAFGPMEGKISRAAVEELIERGG